jgi:arginase
MAPRKRHLEIIGVPVDLGAGRRGVDMGCSAIRIADLEERLEALGHKVVDFGDVDVEIAETQKVGSGKLRYKQPVLSACDALRKEVERSLSEGRMPLVLGGDHSIAIGSIAGSSNHFAKEGEPIGLIWFDAHGDANTPETTPSGNIHGMSLAVSLGMGDHDLVNLGGSRATGPRAFTCRSTSTSWIPRTPRAPARRCGEASPTARRTSRWR